MSEFSISTPGRRLFATTLVGALLLAGCAMDVELDNRQAAQEIARLATPPGSVYMGWRVFQDRCASCHGPAATGTANAPDLLNKVQGMGSREFVSQVLNRYDVTLQGSPAGNAAATAARHAQVEVTMQRREAPLDMPAWGNEPRVSAHIADLYAYLSARAKGSQGPGRPQPASP